MSDSEKTMYVNGNIETSDAFDNDKTVYVGKEENTPVENQTVYIGKESNISKDAVVETDSQTVYIAKETSSVESHTTNHVELEEEYISDKKEEVISESVNLDRTPETAQKEENETLYYLPTNTMLQKRYRINSVLGEGGFGITYSGWDITLNIPVAIKEYYPTGLVTRNATLGKTTQVVPVASSKYASQFRDGIDRVLDEARRMAKFRNTPGIVGIYDFFEANNTAYIVMEYVKGSTLDEYYKNNRVDNTTLFNMLVPVMDALQILHNEGIIHRDISPDNIMVDEEGNFKLLDFGAARGYTEESSTTMSIILKKSYAPEEQFRSKGVQGPWTDVYALAASIYELITGQTPPTSIDRLVDDEIIDIRELAPSLTKSQAHAIMTALAVRQTNRYQKMVFFREALLDDCQSIYEKEINDKRKDKHSSEKIIENRLEVKKRNKIIAVIVIFLALALIAGIMIGVRTTSSNKNLNDMQKKAGRDVALIDDLNTEYDSIEENNATDKNSTNSISLKSEAKGVAAGFDKLLEDGYEKRKLDISSYGLSEIHKAYFGYYVTEIPSDIEIKYNVKGALITSITPGAPMEKSGFKKDDIIIEFNNKAVTCVDDLNMNLEIGDTAKIKILRFENEKYIEKNIDVVSEDSYDYTSSAYYVAQNGNKITVIENFPFITEVKEELISVLEEATDYYSPVIYFDYSSNETFNIVSSVTFKSTYFSSSDCIIYKNKEGGHFWLSSEKSSYTNDIMKKLEKAVTTVKDDGELCTIYFDSVNELYKKSVNITDSDATDTMDDNDVIEDIEDIVLENGIVVSTQPGEASPYGTFQIVEAKLLDENDKNCKIAFKVKTISVRGSFSSASMPVSFLDEDGFEIKHSYINVSLEKDDIVADTCDFVPKETKKIIIKK